MESKINEKLKICKRNKIGGLACVAIVLFLSFVLVNKGVNKINSEKGILEKTVVTKGLDNVQLNILEVPLDTTSNCILPIDIETIPVVETENVYNNTISVLLYTSILLFIVLSLWGTFTVLLKVLKSEHEINSKILDVELKIYNEQQMWKISEQKNNYENEISKEKASSEKEEKDNDLTRRIWEFNEIEKIKLELKYAHELELKEKEKEIQALKEKTGSASSKQKDQPAHDRPTNHTSIDCSR